MKSIRDHLRRCFASPQVPAAPLERVPEIVMRDLPRRWAHVQGVTRLAESLGKQLRLAGKLREDLILAAAFHDIGYAASITQTGLHALDGAIVLAHLGASPEVIEAVFWHGGAINEARHRKIAIELYKKFEPPSESSSLVEYLDYCDGRTSPDGEMFSITQRVREIQERYGGEHIFSQTAVATLPEKRCTSQRILSNIAEKSACPLPWIWIDIDVLTPKFPDTIGQTLARYRNSGGRLSLTTERQPHALSELAQRWSLPGPHFAVTERGKNRSSGEEMVGALNESGWPSLHSWVIGGQGYISNLMSHAGWPVAIKNAVPEVLRVAEETIVSPSEKITTFINELLHVES